MKFTPGPWTYAHTGYGGFYIETPNNEQIRVAAVYHETNARLISAAPDLYEALIDARDALFNGAPITTELGYKVQDALQKVDE